MIRINKGETKEVVFTLKEKISIDNPYFIFELESKDNRRSTLFTASDFSLSKDRYNSFTFSEGITSTFSAGFNLGVGQYNYKVFETSVNNSIDITIGNIVEIGLLEIVGTNSNYINYPINSNDDLEYTYNP